MREIAHRVRELTITACWGGVSMVCVHGAFSGGGVAVASALVGTFGSTRMFGGDPIAGE